MQYLIEVFKWHSQFEITIAQIRGLGSSVGLTCTLIFDPAM